MALRCWQGEACGLGPAGWPGCLAVPTVVVSGCARLPGLPHDLVALREYFGTLAVKQKMRTRSAIMNPLRRVCAKILAGLLPALPGGFARAAQPGQTKALVDGNTEFACDLYAQLRNSPGNLFFSPYSISTALAMTYAGARGNTETQMAHVLHFGKDQARLHSAFGALQRQLDQANQQKGIELSIANALWAQQGHPFLPAFLNLGQGEYQASLKLADFKTGAEAAQARNQRLGRAEDQRQDSGHPAARKPGCVHPARPGQRDLFQGRLGQPFPQDRNVPAAVPSRR